MKTMAPARLWGPVVAAIGGAASPLWAAESLQKDSGDLIVWLFLGFCAVIVVPRLISVLLMFMRSAKTVREERRSW